MDKTCTCGGRFMDPEDWRDHMPCPGNAAERAAVKAAAANEEVAKLRAELAAARERLAMATAFQADSEHVVTHERWHIDGADLSFWTATRERVADDEPPATLGADGEWHPLSLWDPAPETCRFPTADAAFAALAAERKETTP